MATIADVDRLASALDGVRTTTRDGRLRWEVGGRLLARQLDDDAVVIRTAFDARERLVADHPAGFGVPPRFERHMMVVAELPHVTTTALGAALQAAWSLQVS